LDEHTIYHNLLEAMGEAGCPICRLSERAVESYLDHLLYADVNSIERRADIRSARGFCADHAHSLLAIGRALGIAIIYKDVIDNVLRVLPVSTEPDSDSLTGRRRSGRLAAERLLPSQPCPACSYHLIMQGVYIGGFVKHLDNHDFRDRVLGSEGLCLSHLQIALDEPMDGRRRQFLVIQQVDRWQKLSEELGEYIRKNDYRFRSEGFGEESDAWQRALTSISCGRDIKETPRKNASRFSLRRKSMSK